MNPIIDVENASKKYSRNSNAHLAYGVSDLVRTRFGYHIIKLTDRSEDQPPALDEVSLEIRKRLIKDLERRLVRGWLDDLRRRSFIDIKL